MYTLIDLHYEKHGAKLAVSEFKIVYGIVDYFENLLRNYYLDDPRPTLGFGFHFIQGDNHMCIIDIDAEWIIVNITEEDVLEIKTKIEHICDMVNYYGRKKTTRILSNGRRIYCCSDEVESNEVELDNIEK